MTNLRRTEQELRDYRSAQRSAELAGEPGSAANPLPADKETSSPSPGGGAHQFSLAGILLVVGLFAILLGPVIWLRFPWFTGVLGCGSLMVLAVISIFNNRPQVVRVGWWLLAALYLSALTLGYIFS